MSNTQGELPLAHVYACDAANRVELKLDLQKANECVTGNCRASFSSPLCTRTIP